MNFLAKHHGLLNCVMQCTKMGKFRFIFSLKISKNLLLWNVQAKLWSHGHKSSILCIETHYTFMTWVTANNKFHYNKLSDIPDLGAICWKTRATEAWHPLSGCCLVNRELRIRPLVQVLIFRSYGARVSKINSSFVSWCSVVRLCYLFLLPYHPSCQSYVVLREHIHWWNWQQ
jgi:hypothetical protein